MDMFISDLPITQKEMLLAALEQQAEVRPIVEFRVYGFSGLLCTVEVERTWDVAQVMHGIEKASKIPAQEQLLYVGTDPYTSDMMRTTFKNLNVVDLTLVR